MGLSAPHYFCDSMLRPIDNWFLQKGEPVKSCLQFLREYLLKLDSNVTEGFAYGAPHYYYKGRRFCYLWINKKLSKPYIGVIDGVKINHPDLIQEKRARMKVFLVDPDKDIPVRKLNSILKTVLALYK
jgi:hypothetical protein